MNAISPRSSYRSQTDASDDFDMLIVGAGISGIGMAVHLGKAFPDKKPGALHEAAANTSHC